MPNNVPGLLKDRMPSFVDNFVSAISMIKPDDDRDPPGDHLGTGSFLIIEGCKLILTCEHVVNVKPNVLLGMTQFGANHAISIPGIFQAVEHPIDIAVCPVSDKDWSFVSHTAKCIDLEMIAKEHAPVDGEYFYVYGFPGEDAVTGFGQHHHRGLGVISHEQAFADALCNEIPTPMEQYHFCLPYNPELATLLDGDNSVLSKPPGMSGSLVWNTRYVEVTSQGEEWSPEDARVTGVVWGHSSKVGVLVATKIEYIRHSLSIDD